jgi:O-methyltransferase involved in polyketide biosynthesis
MAVRGLDTSKPNIARVYDYWLGGKDNFAADRELAEHMAAIYPPGVQLCRDNRVFVSRAVTWAAEQGIGQFLDLGAGLPTSPSVHDAVREVIPQARVCYVDNDPVVVVHAEALLTKSDGLVAVCADLSDPDAVFRSPGVASVIDPGEPVCVILASVLHFYPEAAARRIVAGYVSTLVPGSVVVISCGRIDDPVMWEQVREMYTAGTLYNHDRDVLVTYFTELEMVPPGLVPACAWRGGMPHVPAPHGPAYVLGAAAMKP